MARIRSIKPEFWTDEKIVKLSPLARLLFIGLWNFADDEGRMKFSPVTIKLQILPLETSALSEEFGELRREGLIITYEAEGSQYLQVTNFSEHQKVDKRTPSKLPRPPSNSPEPPRTSPLDQGREGKGMEGSGGERGDPPGNENDPFAEQRLFYDLPSDWKAQCISEKGWRPDIVENEWIRFRTHYSKKIGRAAARTNEQWLAEWRSWYLGSNIKPDNPIRTQKQARPGVATL
jgi:hypothetical protein